MLYRHSAIFLTLLLCSSHAQADKLHIAVASNFSEAIKLISAGFEKDSGHEVILSFGSTGKHYAQITHGAPFDLFFAADVRRPKLLDETGVAVAGTRFTYAIGRIALWSPQPGLVDEDGQVLQQGNYTHLAIANPKLAPYGKAAQQVLEARGLWSALQEQLVRGENIGQTFQYVRSGNAELGFIAYSQIRRPGQAIEGSYWLVPQQLYTPIEQQAVILKDSAAARAFIAYIQGPEGQGLIRGFGYAVP